MDKLLAILLLLVLLSSGALALGITPGRTVLDYKPGQKTEVEFTVVNSENQDMDIVVFVQGELNRSISLSEVSFSMKAADKEKKLRYIVDIPNGLSPGLHTSEVVVLQLPKKAETSQAFIGAALGVATQIHLFVPYPGKYAEASLNVIGPDDDGSVTFVIPVISRGELDLVRVGAVIDIYSSLNEKIETINTNEVEIPSGQRRDVVAVWKSDAPPGPYRAVATLIYDESTATLETQFNLGNQVLDVVGVEVNDFSLGDIAKFEILVENKWSQQISGAYAQMQVFNTEGAVMADFKSATYDIPSLSKILMIAFWDTEGVREGTYKSSLFLKYGANSEQRELELEVSDNDINVVGVGYVISSGGSRSSGRFSQPLIIVLVAVIVLLIMVNLLWFIYLRKKVKGK